MRLAAGILVAVSACYAPAVPSGAPCDPGLNNCPVGQRCEQSGNDYVCTGSVMAILDGSTSDGGTKPPDSAPGCLGSGLVTNICLMPQPTADLMITANRTINTAMVGGGNCDQIIAQQLGGPSMCMIVGKTITIATGIKLIAQGPNPLLLVAKETFDVMGSIDVASHVNATNPGAGSETTCSSSNGGNGSGADGGGGGGGGGGSFGTTGGPGGNGNGQGGTAGPGGQAAAVMTPGQLRGGCRGGTGGAGSGGGFGGPGAGGAGRRRRLRDRRYLDQHRGFHQRVGRARCRWSRFDQRRCRRRWRRLRRHDRARRAHRHGRRITVSQTAAAAAADAATSPTASASPAANRRRPPWRPTAATAVKAMVATAVRATRST
jgi:hypothetical protein